MVIIILLIVIRNTISGILNQAHDVRCMLIHEYDIFYNDFIMIKLASM